MRALFTRNLINAIIKCMKKEKRSAKEYLKDLLQLFAIFFKIGLFTFGGGYAMLALIEAEVVDKRHWISKEELANIFAISESTPGPIAINTATYIGTQRLGVFGGIIATLGVALPSLIIIIAISYIIDLVKDNRWVQCIFMGIRVGVLVLILKAFVTFYKSIKKNIFSFALLIAAFLIILLTDAKVVYIILGTIVLCTIIEIVKTCINRKRFHLVGTPEYKREEVER